MVGCRKCLVAFILLLSFTGVVVPPASAEQKSAQATLLTEFDGNIPVIGGHFWTNPVLSGDGRWVIYEEGYEGQRMLRRMDRTTGLSTTIAGPAEIFNPSVSSDGRWVAFVAAPSTNLTYQVELWDGNSSSTTTISSSDSYAFKPTISDDGNRVVWAKGATASSSSHDEVVVWTRGSALRTKATDSSPKLSGNGRYVFFDIGGGNGGRRWDLDTDLVGTVDGLFGLVDFSDDGARLAAPSYPGADQAVVLRDIPSGQSMEIALPGSLTLNAPRPVLSGDGSLVLFRTTVALAPEDDGENTYDNYLVRFADNTPVLIELAVEGTFVDVSDDGRYGLLAKTIDELRIELWIVDFEQAPLETPEPGTRPADDQILRLYQAALGRSPDNDGYPYWLGRYRSGESLLSIAAAFADSPEFSGRFGPHPTSLELVEGLYLNVLGRGGDDDGLAYWIAQLNDGLSVPHLIVAFSDSAENIRRTNTSSPITGTEASVIRLYRAALGRGPDASGYTYWVDRLNNGASLLSLAESFSTSAEYTERYGTDPSDQELVSALYENVLDRPGDQEGVDYWIRRRLDGMTTEEIIVAFSNSAENVKRTGTAL